MVINTRSTESRSATAEFEFVTEVWDEATPTGTLQKRTTHKLLHDGKVVLKGSDDSEYGLTISDDGWIGKSPYSHVMEFFKAIGM